MPIYEYKCPSCGKVIEILQSLDDPAPRCPKGCKKSSHPTGVKMKRLISQTSFVLKGGGWYKDGYVKGAS